MEVHALCVLGCNSVVITYFFSLLLLQLCFIDCKFYGSIISFCVLVCEYSHACFISFLLLCIIVFPLAREFLECVL